MTQGEVTGWRPSVWASLTQFWAISIALTVIAAVFGFAAASAPTPKATATASIVLADPSSASLLVGGGTNHVPDQVAIIRLDSTVRAATALLAKRLPSAGVTFDQLKNELSVTGGTASELVQIKVTDVRPSVAEAAANAVVDAYKAQAQDQLTNARTQALTSTQAAIDAILAKISTNPTVAAQQQAALQSLYTQQAQITSDTTAAIGPVQAGSPATLPTAKRLIPPLVGLIAGALAGLVAAIALTRLLAQARQRFAGRFEPELIFATPLLADVPTFSAERLPSDLPSVDSATSSVSEAYRFATSAIRSGDSKIVAVVSAASSEGKSSCAANLAVTAAYQGARVLVIDADFEGKGVSFLLGQDFDRRPGLLDVLDGTVAFEDVVTKVDFADDLSLLSGGQAAGYDWPDVLSTSRWPQLAKRLGERYDLVIIDLPPFLQIAYAVPIVRACDGVVVVIPHKSSVSRGAELAERLRFVGVETLGYLYVKSPLRREIGLVSRLATDEERRPMQRGKRAVLPVEESPARGRIPIATIPLEHDEAPEPVAGEAGPPAEPAGSDPAPLPEPVAELPAHPAVDEPVVDEPVVDEPVAEAPVADGPAAEEPAADEPVADEPVEEPVADKPVTDEPLVAAADTDEPAAEETATPEPAEDAPVPEEFLAGTPTPLVVPPEPASIPTTADVLPVEVPTEFVDEPGDTGEPFVVPAGVPRASLLEAMAQASGNVAADDGAGPHSTAGPSGSATRPAVAAFRSTGESSPANGGSAVLTEDGPDSDGGAEPTESRSPAVRAGASVNRPPHSRNRKPRPRR